MFGLFNDTFGDFGYVSRHNVWAYDPFFGYYYKSVWKNYDPFGINSLGAFMYAMNLVIQFYSYISSR